MRKLVGVTLGLQNVTGIIIGRGNRTGLFSRIIS